MFQASSPALRQLRKADNPGSQYHALQVCRELSLHQPAFLRAYHDALLFVCAYPFNEKIHRLAELELERLMQFLKKKRQNPRWQYQLSGSGLPFTELRCQYSAALLQWLLREFPGEIQPVEADTPGDTFMQLCQALLPGIEFHRSTQGKLGAWNRVKQLSGHTRNAAALRWILDLIQQQPGNLLLKDLLFDGLRIYISWIPRNARFSRTCLRWPIPGVHYRKPGKRKINSLSWIERPLDNPVVLSQKAKEELITVARVSLALYYRETDPVTYADPAETFLFDMGGGLLIALLGMEKERRLSLESYIGFMAFRNGIPVAYGGGWLFGHRCKIGINIYPPFRGGESDLLFCQVLRLYYQRYQVKRFVVKPYQFGKGNTEGLKSGAFWFYYKLGFRPVNPAIKKIADGEWKKIRADERYRTPLETLKRFTACNKEWEPRKNKVLIADADLLSQAVTAMIRSRFAADRHKAAITCMAEMNKFLGIKKYRKRPVTLEKTWQNWSLLFACLPGTGSWSKASCRKFLELLHLKAGGDEREFILALQRHNGFWKSVNELTGSSAK